MVVCTLEYQANLDNIRPYLRGMRGINLVPSHTWTVG